MPDPEAWSAELQLIYTDNALRDLSKIPKDVVARILARLDSFAAGTPSDVKKLVGRDEFRMRVGDYRIMFKRDGDTARILRVVHRKDAY